VPEWARRRGTRLLVAAVVGDVLIAGVLRAQNSGDFIAGARDWRTVLGFAGCLYLLVVLYALIRVVGDQQRLHRQVRGRDDRIAAIELTSGEWLWELGPDLVLTYSSLQLTDVLGYDPAEVVGKSVLDYMTPQSAGRVQQAMRIDALAQGWRNETSEWVAADGRLVLLRHSGVPLRDRNNRLIGFRGSCSPVEGRQADRGDAMLRERVNEVLDAGPLPMALQPIIEVATGRVIGAEALARFPDGRPPTVWFDEAGEAGLRFELETHAIFSAVRRLSELPAEACLSVNAGPEVITDPRFVPLMVESGLPLDRLVLEVTEHVRIDAYEGLVDRLAALRAAGMRLAVDDAGAGYASLTHVLHLRPDIVKLDRSLIANVDSDRARRTLITSLTLLAMDIGAEVTAEGVETTAELEAVADLGIDHAQGYLIGRPSLEVKDWPRQTALS
jgi:PAS domain S-box-containing protein